MANNHETLTSLFTDIADAIREKTGGTESIVADQFPEVIAEIDTQEDLDAEIDTQDNVIARLMSAVGNLSGKTVESGKTKALVPVPVMKIAVSADIGEIPMVPLRRPIPVFSIEEVKV